MMHYYEKEILILAVNLQEKAYQQYITQTKNNFKGSQGVFDWNIDSLTNINLNQF